MSYFDYLIVIKIKIKKYQGFTSSSCKDKCLIFPKESVNYNEVTPILLNELPLPFVNDLKHLGNVLKVIILIVIIQ